MPQFKDWNKPFISQQEIAKALGLPSSWAEKRQPLYKDIQGFAKKKIAPALKMGGLMEGFTASKIMSAIKKRIKKK